jgi:hypothetical protein
VCANRTTVITIGAKLKLPMAIPRRCREGFMQFVLVASRRASVIQPPAVHASNQAPGLLAVSSRAAAAHVSAQSAERRW